MRADKLYEHTLALLGEEEYSNSDFAHIRFPIINQALSMCLSAYNTQIKSRGENEIKCFEEIKTNSQPLKIDDNFAIEVLSPIVGALLISDHDRDKANLLFEMADAAKKKYSKVNFVSIQNAY